MGKCYLNMEINCFGGFTLKIPQTKTVQVAQFAPPPPNFLHQVPQLTSPPVNTHALAILSSVAGEALTKHLSKILPALMAALTKEQGTSQEDIVLEHCQTVSPRWRMESAR